MTERLKYTWPDFPLDGDARWSAEGAPEGFVARAMPEDDAEVAADSRWPAFFPSPICIVTTGDGASAGLERVVGPSVVNRFPYILALSLCRTGLSSRHYERRRFMDMIEKNGGAAVQFLPPGPGLDAALKAIASTPDERVEERIGQTGLAVRPGSTNPSPVFRDAYLVYEVRLARPQKDYYGAAIFREPWVDIGSHRLYFLEIGAIQLRPDVAEGKAQVAWQSLPSWRGDHEIAPRSGSTPERGVEVRGKYQKPYRANYRFPSANTVCFESDCVEGEMAVRKLPSVASSQIEKDNDKARWPCFFPSPLAMITSWTPEGLPNLMPCGSTTVVSRHPFVIGACICYAAINDRYAPRATYEIIRRTGRFGCSVPYDNEVVAEAITYSGNVSIADDPQKLENSGLSLAPRSEWSPVLKEFPVHFDCEVVGEVRLGTHVMFLGEVRRVLCSRELGPASPLKWSPWAEVAGLDG